MSKKTKENRVPKLRFPEFQDAGEWETVKFIDIADKKIRWSFIGGPFGSNLKSSDYVGNGVRVIQLQNIGDAEFINGYKIYTSKKKADELISNNIYPGDIILSKMGDPVGRACLVPDSYSRYVMCSDGIRLAVDTELFSKYFIYTLINSTQFRATIEKVATGSTRKRIGLDDLKKLPMLVPIKRNEQQKIADCLSSLDDLISAHTKKIKTLKDHKKGLMQQLFPKEGEKIPKLRFPEFRDAGEWKERKFDEVADFYKGKKISKADIDLQGKIPCIRYGELYTHYNEVIKDVLSKTKLPTSELVFSCKNDVLIPSSGETKLDIAIASCIMLDGVALGGDINIIRSNQDGKFISYYLNGSKKMEISKIAQGDTVTHLYSSQLRLLNLILPSLKEQQRIADCLSRLDELISAQTEKIKTLKDHKKGLMQQLFPNIDEVEA